MAGPEACAAVAAVSAVLLLVIDDELSNAERSSAPGRNIQRAPFSFLIHFQGLTDSFFRRVYRMPKPTFFRLVQLIEEQSAITGRARYCVASKLSMTIRWLAGGSYLDISMSHGVAPQTFYFCVNQILLILNSSLKLRFPVSDREQLTKISENFEKNGRNPLKRCVGALDGIAIRIAEPGRGTVPNPSTYYNRKGFFSLNVQAMCDSEYRFLYLSSVTPGSTHDSTAFSMSSLCRTLAKESNRLLKDFWIAADSAYVC